MGFSAKIGLIWSIMMKMTAVAYKEGISAAPALSLARVVQGLTAALMIGLSAATAAEGQHGVAAMTCTNPVSGANWQIRIDYDRHTVDSNPADISETTISWRDGPNGWKYQLDRKSGALTVTLASATGGNFLYDQCKRDK